MPQPLKIWNAYPISEAVRENMNIGVSATVLDVAEITYYDGKTHYDDLSSLFNVGNETVRRWYGYEAGATNRLIPKVAEGYRICEIRKGMVQHSGPRPPLNPEYVDNLRLRCFLASMTGLNTEGQSLGLNRDALWSGKEREIEKGYRTCSEMLLAWDDYYMGRPGGKEGAYIFHAWERAVSYYDQADAVWRLNITCRDKAFVLDPPSGGGGGGGGIVPESYDEIEVNTDDEGNEDWSEAPSEDGEE